MPLDQPVWAAAWANAPSKQIPTLLLLLLVLLVLLLLRGRGVVGRWRLTHPRLAHVRGEALLPEGKAARVHLHVGIVPIDHLHRRKPRQSKQRHRRPVTAPCIVASTWCGQHSKRCGSAAITFWLSLMHPPIPGMPQISRIWYIVSGWSGCLLAARHPPVPKSEIGLPINGLAGFPYQLLWRFPGHMPLP